MRLIGDLLGEVLANTAKLVAERKVCGMNTLTGHEVTPYGVPVAPGGVRSGRTRGPQSPSEGSAAGVKSAGDAPTEVLKPGGCAFTADHSLPAQRVTGPKSTEGGKQW